ncbi:MAG TPA: B12-binding domain-containing radical SAM protein [Deltaproteobacteria bacterium]|nr:B12-binding domain-containing radical SAM protein [Deltaproteobacteria bacterium]
MMTNPDIVLVNAGGTRKQVYQDLSKVFSAIDTPFWAALTAGYLRGKGFDVNILDANALNLDPDETVKALADIRPKFIAIVCYSQQANVSAPIMVAVGDLCRRIKEELPETPLLLTGWHPSALPERTMREEACDMLVQGEGFQTLSDLLSGVPVSDIRGLWWKKDSRIFHGPPAENIKDLSAELPDVAWDLLPMDNYRAFSWMCLRDFSERTKFASIFTSLGCPFRCSFCAIHATYGEHRIRYWSPEWVLRQLDILVNQYGVRHINIHDELFVFNPKHYLPIAEGIMDRGYDLNINAFARVDVLDRVDIRHLETLKKAGFHWLKLGIETGSSRIRANVNKDNYGIDAVRNAVNRAHSVGMDFCANFMFGLPGDDYGSMQDTLNLALDLMPAFPSFFCAMAIPGSDLYTEALEKNLPLPDTWLGYASQGYDFLPLPTEHLTAAQVVEFRDYAFDTYFKNPGYLTTIENKFGREARKHIKEMTAIRLKRKILGD